jgi:hypothetical protein
MAPGSRPRRLLYTAAALLAGAGMIFGSSARFDARATNPSNTFSAGTLSISDSDAGAAILTASGLKPGDDAVGDIEIENTGSVPGTLQLTRPALEDSDVANPLSARLGLVIVDCGETGDSGSGCDGQVVFRGTLAEMTGSSALGTYGPGERHRYRFSLTLDPGAGNLYQGDTSTATFRWDATQ